MLRKKHETILIQSNIRQWTHVVLVNTPYSHAHGFRVTGLSNGLGIMLKLTRVLQLRLVESATWGDLLLI